jgi:hypothetical protein
LLEDDLAVRVPQGDVRDIVHDAEHAALDTLVIFPPVENRLFFPQTANRNRLLSAAKVG